MSNGKNQPPRGSSWPVIEPGYTPNGATKKHHTVTQLRCGHCKKLLAERVTRPYRIKCRGCKKVTQAD